MEMQLMITAVTQYPFHIIGWYSIMKCYIELNQKDNAAVAKEKIDHLLEHNEHSKEMFEKYGDLMEGFELESGELVKKPIMDPRKELGSNQGKHDIEPRHRKNVAHPDPYIPDLTSAGSME